MLDRPRFTIIVPTHNHRNLLAFSLKSIQAQTIQDFSVEIIGDGADRETAKIAKRFVKKDPRFHFYDFPKSLRTGEEYRDELLKRVQSKYICYLSDDDLWFPDHLETLLQIFKNADFVYTFPLMINKDNSVGVWYGNFSDPFYRKLFLYSKNKRYNFIPLSCAAHTIKSYRSLTRGWQTTPTGKHTDLHMWQVFASQKNVRIHHSWKPTILHFASSQRSTMSVSARIIEQKYWFMRLKNDQMLREDLVTRAMSSTYTDFLQFRAAIQSTKTWKLHDALLRLIQRLRQKIQSDKE